MVGSSNMINLWGAVIGKGNGRPPRFKGKGLPMKAMLTKRVDGSEVYYIEDHGVVQLASDDSLTQDDIDQLIVWGNRPTMTTITGWELTPDWEVIWQA
jgi:hypothetical protein